MPRKTGTRHRGKKIMDCKNHRATRRESRPSMPSQPSPFGVALSNPCCLNPFSAGEYIRKARGERKKSGNYMKGEGHLEVYSASNRFSVPFSGTGKPPAKKAKKKPLMEQERDTRKRQRSRQRSSRSFPSSTSELIGKNLKLFLSL